MWISRKHDVRPRESTVPIKYSSLIQAAAEEPRGRCVDRLQVELPSVVLLVALHWIFSPGGSTPLTESSQSVMTSSSHHLLYPCQRSRTRKWNQSAADPDVSPVVHRCSGSFGDHWIDGSFSLDCPAGSLGKCYSSMLAGGNQPELMDPEHARSEPAGSHLCVRRARELVCGHVTACPTTAHRL